MANKNNSKCLEKAADDEPIFVLRAQDFSSPVVILKWISENIHTCPDDKLREAFEVALKMKYYPVKKNAD